MPQVSFATRLGGRLRSVTREGWRRKIAALYGVAFFLAVAVAPHRHFNSLEDLLSDGPFVLPEGTSLVLLISPVPGPAIPKRPSESSSSRSPPDFLQFS